jgi:hypothetical protein
MDGRVPVTHPGNPMLLRCGHERLRSSTMRTPTDGVDLIADSDASVRYWGGEYNWLSRLFRGCAWTQQGHTRRDRDRISSS